MDTETKQPTEESGIDSEHPNDNRCSDLLLEWEWCALGATLYGFRESDNALVEWIPAHGHRSVGDGIEPGIVFPEPIRI
jgi:hypothetical protein